MSMSTYTLKKVTEQDTHYDLRSGRSVITRSSNLADIRMYAVKILKMTEKEFDEIPYVYSCIGTKRRPQKLDLPWQSSGGFIKRAVETAMCLSTLVAFGDVMVEDVPSGLLVGTKYQCIYCKFNHACLTFQQGGSK